MISLEKLTTIAQKYEDDLREFRLTGDLAFLLPLINEAEGASALILVKDFYNALTINEKTAFLAIREAIGLSGNISIVKMIQKTNLSRPVWNSLLQKMEKYGIAQVKSQGVKGTYIEIVKEIEDVDP